jgi:hypothetical protein
MTEKTGGLDESAGERVESHMLDQGNRHGDIANMTPKERFSIFGVFECENVQSTLPKLRCREEGKRRRLRKQLVVIRRCRECVLICPWKFFLLEKR